MTPSAGSSKSRRVGLLLQRLDLLLAAGDLGLALHPVGAAKDRHRHRRDAQDHDYAASDRDLGAGGQGRTSMLVPADDVRGARRGGQGDDRARARCDDRLHGLVRAGAARSGTWNRRGMTDSAARRSWSWSKALLLAMDKAVPRLDAIAHHLALIAQQGEEHEVVGGDQRPGRGHRRRAVRGQRSGEAARVGQRDRRPREGALKPPRRGRAWSASAAPRTSWTAR